MDNNGPLISLSPHDALTFRLQKDLSPKVVLTVSNISNQRVAFKVKTTQPTWYFVRPNQHVLEVGATEQIAIALVEAECNRVVDQATNTGVLEKLDKHRFLVLSKGLSDDEYTRITDCSTAELKQAEFSKLWSTTSKDDKKNLKLQVEYIYPNSGASASPTKGDNSRSNSVNNQSAAAGSSSSSSAGVAGSKKPSSGSKASSSDSGGGSVEDLQDLKRKYDAIVEYTVHLTAERDMIVTQLDVLKREYNSELAKHKKGGAGKDTPTSVGGRDGGDGGDASSKGAGSDADGGKMVKQQQQHGFSAVVLILVAILAFLLGRYALHI